MKAEQQDSPTFDQNLFGDVFNKIFVQGMTLGEVKGFTKEEIEAVYTMSYALYQQKKFQQAEEIFSFLCFNGHTDDRFWIGLGACREGLEKYPEAIDAYSYAALLAHDNPIPPLQAAKCYLALNDLAQARDALDGVIRCSKDEPKHQAIHKQALEILKALNQKEQDLSHDH